MRVILTRILLPLAVLISLAACAVPIATSSEQPDSQDLIVTNGVRFQNTKGEGIWGNGGNILQANDGYFYWYGEKRDGSGNFAGISCHRSKDLVHWEERDDILSPEDSPELNPALVERPKVIYNAKTKKYVLWFHKENAYWDYGLAKAAVAVGDTPDGQFEYTGSFRPFEEPEFGIRDNGYTSGYWDKPSGYENRTAGFMSRDCTLFIDDDGTAYFISATMENYWLHIYRLTDDYLRIDTTFWPINPSVQDEQMGSGWVETNRIGHQREAPCLFKRGDYYFMVTSGTSGWAATNTTYHYTTDLAGNWTAGSLPATAGAGSNNDRSQPTYVFTLQGTKGTSYLYMGDRWGPAIGKSLSESQMVWAPLRFTSDTAFTFSFSDALEIDAAAGEIRYPQYYNLVNEDGNYARSENVQSNGAYMPGTDGMFDLAASGHFRQQWRLIPAHQGFYIANRFTGWVLETSTVDTMGVISTVEREEGNSKQWWTFEQQDNGYMAIKSPFSGKYFSAERYEKASWEDWNNRGTVTNGNFRLWQVPWKWRFPSYLEESKEQQVLEKMIKAQRWKLVPVDSN